MDVRRAARWLETQPHVEADKISILGTSLGGFVGAVASGVDGGFHRSVFVLAGGRLEQVLASPSKEVRSAREAIAADGITTEELVRKLVLVEPCTFAHRIDGRSVLMINTRDDPVVPPASAGALAKAIGGVNVEWYAGDHYALAWRLPLVLARVGEHLEGPDTPAHGTRPAEYEQPK
jgi:cephalosporin-C deacetylase-like acetyl esterase